MNIIVCASALRSSGALTIYKQFINHLSHNIRDNKFYIFISEGMPQIPINGVQYIVSKHYTGLRRVMFAASGCKHYLSKHNIKADYIICLQNTSINAPKHCQTIIYYHQSLPFYPHKWNPLKRSERNLFVYKYFYPIFVRAFLRPRTVVVVQTQVIKDAFAAYFKHPVENIRVLFPDLTDIGVKNVEKSKLDADYLHLVYPATAMSYKNHKILCEALGQLRISNPKKAQRIRLHFTITEDCCPDYLLRTIAQNNVRDNILFDGPMPFMQLLGLYKAADAMVFPSTIETLGLPLIEAASFGLPIIAADLAYAREVLHGYDGVVFIAPYDAAKWMNAICLLERQQRYVPLQFCKEGSWNDFFQLIN